MTLRFIPNTGFNLGKNDRIKRFSLGKLFPIIFPSFLALVISISCLSFYTDWILHRKYDAAKNKIVKNWLPNLTFFRGIIPTSIKENQVAIKNVLFAKEYPEQVDIPSIRLTIQRNGFDILNSQIFQYGMGRFEKKQRINGIFHLSEKLTFPVSINLRGVMAQHHMVWKPSLRVKLKGKKTLNGYRDHLLVAPEDGTGFSNWLTNMLSNKWGLLNIDDHFVRLFVNNKYMGIYNRMWRLDESLFINSGRLPGYFFNLEHLDKREFQRVWERWTREVAWGVGGPDKEKGKELLKRTLETANNILNWKAEYGRQDLIHRILTLNDYFDQDSFAKYLALLCHAGENHVDSRHNNSFWLDSGNGKIIPLLEDVTGYDFFNSEVQLIRPIHRQDGAFIQVWLQNPDNVDRYIQRLVEVLDTIGSVTELESVIRNKWKALRPSALADINLSGKSGQGKRLMSVTDLDGYIDRIVDFVRNRNQWLKEQLKYSRLSVVSQSGNEFEIFLEGFAGIFAQRKDGKSFSLNGDDGSYSSVKLKVANNTVKTTYLKSLYNIPNFYAFYKLPGKPEEYDFIHSITKKPLKFSPAPDNLKVLRLASGLNMLEIPQPNQTPVVLGPGEVIIEQTREFDIGQPIIIKPGTKLALGPKTSLIIRGPIHVEGSPEQPVIVRRLNPQLSFGVVAIMGKETKGSRIKYLDIEGGSVDNWNNLDFTGMFSVHDNPGIEIANSRFGPNFVGDDAVHFVRSQVKIKNSVFEDARSDAVDWDLVDGEIIDSVFRNSGNDGLDVSMGTVRVINTYFEKSGDKCISAGEGTQTTVLDSKFSECNVGIAVKDRSKVELANNIFSGNNIAYNTYRKKWRWQRGGEGFIRDTQFLDSVQTDIKGDKLSKISIDSPLENLRIEGKLKVTVSSEG